MTFLNGILLAGAAALAIPVLIHLFHRSRFTVVPWGAMHLLESVLRRNSRRVRLEQILLLLVRASIPVLLAFCMARPVLTGWAPLLGEARSSVVLLLDDSYSMEAGPAGGRSAFQEAQEIAVEILQRLPPGSEAGAVLMAAGARPLFEELTTDLDRLRGEVARLRGGFGTADVPAALAAARALLARARNPHREVVVIGDFQKVSWSESGTAARLRLSDELRRGPVRPEIVLFPVGRPVTENVAVERLRPSREILGVGQKLGLRAHLRNYGEASYPDLRVVFKVDGRERDVARASLGPGEEVQVLFTHTFDAAGSHVVEVETAADPLAADNRRLLSVPVWDRLPVLLVSGDPNPDPLRGETDFLEIALRPYAAARAEPVDLVVPQVVEARDLDARRLSEARAVVLANVPQLSEPQLRALEDFVRAGGGLLVFPGNRINSAWYNAAFLAGGRGLLPLPVASLAGSLSPSGSRASIVSQHYAHPALELFNDPRNGSLSDAQIWLWYRMRPDAASREGEAAPAVVATLDTGDPFLVEKKYGEGRVLQCAVPCDADWSNLPLRPTYLPLMQQLVAYLASRAEPPRNVDVGRPLVAFLPASAAGKKAALVDPEGKSFEVPVADRGGRAVAEFGPALRPGLYVLEVPGQGPLHFVAHTDPKESDLRRLSPEEIEAEARRLGAAAVDSWAAYRRLDQRRRYGREIWPALLAVVVGLLFLEVVLEQAFARRGAVR
jgi:hypothetical protein